MLCMPSCLSHAWLCVTPWSVACQAHPSMGFSRDEYWSELPFPSLGDLPDPGIEPASLMSPGFAGGFFTSNATWETPYNVVNFVYICVCVCIIYRYVYYVCVYIYMYTYIYMCVCVCVCIYIYKIRSGRGGCSKDWEERRAEAGGDRERVGSGSQVNSSGGRGSHPLC